MTLKELAHAAQQALQTRAGCDVKRSHVHELPAAAFGYQSWAAFLSESMLFDAGVGDASAGATPRVSGRAVQLQYAQGAAVELAGTVLDFVAERQLSSVRWPQVADVLTPAKRVADDDGPDDEEDWDDDDEAVPVEPAIGLTRDRLLRSPLLMRSLEHAAGAPNPRAHHLLAALYRCERPNPYLYEESLKGCVLTAVERGWVDEYLRLEPQFRKRGSLATRSNSARSAGLKACAGAARTACGLPSPDTSPSWAFQRCRVSTSMPAISHARCSRAPAACAVSMSRDRSWRFHRGRSFVLCLVEDRLHFF